MLEQLSVEKQRCRLMSLTNRIMLLTNTLTADIILSRYTNFCFPSSGKMRAKQWIKYRESIQIKITLPEDFFIVFEIYIDGGEKNNNNKHTMKRIWIFHQFYSSMRGCIIHLT